MKRLKIIYTLGMIILLSGVVSLAAVPKVSAAPVRQGTPVRAAITAANVSQLAEVAALDHGQQEVLSAAFSPDGTLLATGAEDGVIRLFGVAAGTPSQVDQWKAHDLDINSLAFSPDGKLLASGGWDGWVRLWDMAHHDRAVFESQAHAEPVYAVAFSPDGSLLASAGGYQENAVRVWDAATYRQLAVLRGHYDWVTSAAFSKSGDPVLVSGSSDGSIREWDWKNSQPIGVIGQQQAPVGSVLFTPSGDVVSASLDGTISQWGLSSTGAKMVIHTGPVWQIAYTPDGSVLAAGERDGSVTFWDPTTGGALGKIQAASKWVNALAFNPAGTLLATADSDGKAILWGVPGTAAQPPATTLRQSDDIPRQMEALALRIHLHNTLSQDFTVWPGGDLGTQTGLKPTWTLGKSLDGWQFAGLGTGQKGFSVSDLKRPTLINFWASWCPPCVQEFPLLAEIALAPEKHAYDVVFVNTWDEETAALKFLLDQPQGLKLGLDADGKLLTAIGSQGIPTSILLDAQHRVIAIQIGNYTSVQAALFDLLARYPDAYTGSFDPSAQPAPDHFVEIQPVDAAQALPIEIGKPVQGTISDDAVQTVYHFDGHAGDVVTVRMDAAAIRPDVYLLEPYVVLLAPDGSYVAESRNYLYESFAQVENVHLPVDGTYRVVATRYMGSLGVSSGDYSLQVSAGQK